MSLLNEDWVFSYSQLSGFDECPYSLYLEKIEKNPTVLSNGFAEYGTLIHDILDEWAKGIIDRDEMVPVFKARFGREVLTPFPRRLRDYKEKAFDLGVKYFEDFDSFEGYEIVSSEDKFRNKICGRNFVGIIDLVLRNKETGKLVVVDHKSKSLATFKKEEDHMYRQQYLYSQYVYEKYGEWPETLMFNLFKENGLKKTRPFSKVEFDEVMIWANDVMERMETYDLFDFLQTKEVQLTKKGTKREDMYCTEICDMRAVCEQGNPAFYKDGYEEF